MPSHFSYTMCKSKTLATQSNDSATQSDDSATQKDDWAVHQDFGILMLYFCNRTIHHFYKQRAYWVF